MLTNAERAALKSRYPNHWFTKIVRHGVERIVAIPKSDPPRDIPSMPGMTADLLHGATIHLTGDADPIERQLEGAA